MSSANSIRRGGTGEYMSYFKYSGSNTYDPKIHPYCQCAIYPTRDGKNRMFFTWNTSLTTNKKYFSFVGRIWYFFYDGDPNELQFKDSYTLSQVSNGAPRSWFSNKTLNVKGSLSSIPLNNCPNGDLWYDWVDVTKYPEYEEGSLCFAFAYYYSNEKKYRVALCWCTPPAENRVIASAPSFEFDTSTGNFTIGTAMEGRRILEFYNESKADVTSTGNNDTLHEFLLTTLLDTERHKPMECYAAYYEDVLSARICRWQKGQYTMGVNFRSDTNKTTISTAIDEALEQINSILKAYDIFFTRNGVTTGDLSIIVDSEKTLFGKDLSVGGYYYGGQWETTIDGNGNITSATVKLANDVYEAYPFSTYKTTALEEILQAMGCGFDQTEICDDTIHIEFNYLNKPDTLKYRDKAILQLLYSDYVHPGDNAFAVSKALNLPKGVYCPSAANSDTAMTIPGTNFIDFESSDTIKVRAFIVNENGQMSGTTNWVYVEPPELGTVSTLTADRRVNGGMRLRWNAASNADGYQINIDRNYDRKTIIDTTATGLTYEARGLNPGTTHTVYVRAYANYGGHQFRSSWKTLYFTTNPARPKIHIVSTKNGSIELDWELEDPISDYTNIWINIYKDSSDTEKLAGTTIESGSGKKGHVTLIIPSEEWYINDGETFYLKAQVMYADDVSGTNLKCLTDDGAEYKFTQAIVVTSRPDKFAWDTPKTGKRFTIGIDEVNRLGENINEVREYMDCSSYIFTTVSRGMTMSAALYNSWVDAIKGISGFGTYLNHVSAGDRITAALLNAVVQELNAVEKEDYS